MAGGTGPKLEVGELLDGRYRIVRKLGEGGMGIVWAAERTTLGDTVAIKCVTAARNTPTNRARFLREAKAVARIRHPNVIAVFDFGDPPDRPPYMVMEYLDGPTLGQVLEKKGQLDVPQAVALFGQICAAVEAGHRRGVIHRDLKPANVMFTRTDDGGETLKVLDFGLATVDDEDKMHLTTPGSMLGTVAYMAPEQVEGSSTVGPPADVFSLTVLLYEMLTGHKPFQGANRLGTLVRIAEGKHDDPREHRKDLDEGLVAAIARGLARSTEDRPGSASELFALFESFATEAAGPISLDLGSLRDLQPAPEADTGTSVPTPAAGTQASAASSGGLTEDPAETITAIADVPEEVLQAARAGREEDPDLSSTERRRRRPLIGRAKQLAELDRALERALEGDRTMLLLTGETGVGKSQVLDRFLERARDQRCEIFRGRFFAYEGDRPPPYETFFYMLGRGSSEASSASAASSPSQPELSSIVGRRVASGRAAMQPGVNVQATAEGDKWRVFADLAQSFLTRSRGRPLVIALDDLHWATSLDLELLAYLPHATQPHPVLIVGTAELADRSEAYRWARKLVAQRALKQIAVDPFSPEQVREWLGGHFGSLRIRPADVRRLTAASNGIPFALEEVVRGLVEGGRITETSTGWVCEGLKNVSLPNSVQALLESRIESLDEEVRLALEQACVIGEEFRFETLHEASGMDEDELEDLLEAAVKARVLVDRNLTPGADFGFASRGLRGVLYDGLSSRKRKRYHKKVVRTLEELYGGDGTRIARVLAYHHAAIGDWSAALPHALTAAEEALDRHDQDAAETVLEHARAAVEGIESEDGSLDAELLARHDLVQALLLARIGQPAAAVLRARRALETAIRLGNGPLELRARLALLPALSDHSDYRTVIDAADDTIALADALEERVAADRARVHLGRALALLGRYDAAEAALRPILATGPDRALQALALREMAWLSAKRGHFDAAVEAADRAIGAAREARDAMAEYRAVSVRGLVLGEYGDYDRAIEGLEEALKLARALSLRSREAIELMNIGECHLLANRAEQAQQRLAKALEIFIEVENRALEGECRVVLGGLLVRMGDPVEARSMLENGLEITRDYSRAEIVATGLCELAGVDLADGQLDAAIVSYREAATHYADMKSVKRWRAELPLARLLHGRGEVDEARTRAEAAAAQLREQLRVLPDDASRAELETELAAAMTLLGG